MNLKNPLLHSLDLKENLRKVLKLKFRAGLITKEELSKRCLELTKKHN